MRGDPLGVLHGLPVSVKDLLLTRGSHSLSMSLYSERTIRLT